MTEGHTEVILDSEEWSAYCELVSAAEEVLKNWGQGDLAAAVRRLAEAVAAVDTSLGEEEDSDEDDHEGEN